MKYLKMLALLAVAAAALLAFAGSASATIVTSPEGTTYTSSVATTSTNSELDGSFVTVKCGHSEGKGNVNSHGGSQVHIFWASLTFTGCNYEVTVIEVGTITITSTNVVIATGFVIVIHTSVGTCGFSTNGTTIGNLVEGKNAWMDIASSKIPRTSGNFLCGSSGTWTGSYDLTTPNDAWVD